MVSLGRGNNHLENKLSWRVQMNIEDLQHHHALMISRTQDSVRLIIPRRPVLAAESR